MLFATLVVLVASVTAGPIDFPIVRLPRNNEGQQFQTQSLTSLESGFGMNIKIGNQDLSVYLTMGEANGLTVFGSFKDGHSCFFRPQDSPTFERKGSIGCPFDQAFEKLEIGGICLEKTAFAYADSRYAPAEFGGSTGQVGSLALGLGTKSNAEVGALFPTLVKQLDAPIIGFTLPSKLSDTGLHPRQRGSGRVRGGRRASAKEVVRTRKLAASAGLYVNRRYVDPDEVYRNFRRSALYSRNNDKPAFTARFEIASDVLQISPKLAEAIFALVPGAVSTEWHGTRSNDDKIASVESSTGVARLEHGCSYEVPCDTNSTISFKFKDVMYDLPPRQWVIPCVDKRRTSNKMCKTRVFVPKTEHVDSSIDILLGAPFLETVYTAIYYEDEPKIGFTKLDEL
ncbi:unnamed protein product [Cutaneotrichosporon oleaginosum]